MTTQAIKDKALAATRGTQFGAILRCHWHVERDAAPRFEGRATVTSDGFIMCNFVDKAGDAHWGAFVAGVSDFKHNIDGLAKHLQLEPEERDAFSQDVYGWIGKDWRLT